MKRLVALWTLCCALGSLPAYSWWQTGHKTIARVAAAHLTPAARTRVARILNVPDNPANVADALAQASVWADETKGETHTGNWHYINLILDDHKSDITERCPHHNCAPARIHLFVAQLAAKTPGTQWSDLDALRYVVHLVGDIHQPLHTITDDDMGGNCELLPEPIQRADNLHALWDGGIVAEISHNDRELADNLDKEIDAWSSFHRYWASRGDQDDWTWESHEIAVRDIYQRLHIPAEPPMKVTGCQEASAAITSFRPATDATYIDEMKPVVRMQLEKASLRLARLLNDTF
jgi:nuclease S1